MIDPAVSLEALIERVEQLFDCEIGYQSAYADRATIGATAEQLKADTVGRDPYRYRVLQMFASSWEGDAWLRRALWNSFVKLHDSARDEGRSPRPQLFWRNSYKISEDRCGTPIRDRELSCGVLKIYARIAIPGADWSVLVPSVPVVER